MRQKNASLLITVKQTQAQIIKCQRALKRSANRTPNTLLISLPSFQFSCPRCLVTNYFSYAIYRIDAIFLINTPYLAHYPKGKSSSSSSFIKTPT
ncbi:hypothetical protein EYC84_002013 [Monilinia fructicola]|uniref:Uncharacterized protein n=1 Tax=Monilinia fructicola TaxID=38448 RepID=A0A5M9JRF1_MONFR|nr:hypothetical protein EYC84_002013 [Monilinia fructicola]